MNKGALGGALLAWQRPQRVSTILHDRGFYKDLLT